MNYNLQTKPIPDRYLRPVTDNANPQRLAYANPSLLPVLEHQATLSYFKVNPATGDNSSAGCWAAFKQRDIVEETGIDNNGIQYTKPINVSNTARLNGWLDLGRSVSISDSVQVDLSLGGWLSANRNILIFNGIEAWYYNFSGDLSLGADFNWQDKVMLLVEYRPNISGNSLQDETFDTPFILNHTFTVKPTFQFLKHFICESDLNYRYFPSISSGFRKSSALLNASISYQFLKGDRGQLKLSTYDLLNQNLSLARRVYGNVISNSSATTLRRYVMLSFIYELRPEGETQKKSRRGGWFNW